MTMKDWNGYRAQVVAGGADFAKLSPDTVRGYSTLSGGLRRVVTTIHHASIE